MPAKKPESLNVRKTSRAEKTARIENESAMGSGSGLSSRVPPELYGKKIAGRVWKKLITAYEEKEAEIISDLDFYLVLNFCILYQQILELDLLRESAFKVWDLFSLQLDRLNDAGQFEEAILMADKVLKSFDKITKIDARVDTKRKHFKDHMESLYLTPRSRAGTSPDRKTPQPEKSALDKFLDEVTDDLNLDAQKRR